MAFERVAALADIPRNGGLRVTVAGLTLGLFRIGDEVFCMDDVCPHAGYSLAEGEIEGSCIVCPAHGWEFDVRTGLAPGEIDEEPLDRYAVRVEGGSVYVDIEERLRDP